MHVVDQALEKLKRDGVVHPEARLNIDAERDLRREVTYRDYDLQYRLARSPEQAAVVEAARRLLVSLNLIPPDANYDETAFDALRAQVKASFQGTWTTITPVMERLLYMLTAVRRPRWLVELGSFWGNTLAWFAGPCLGPRREYIAERVIGIDVDVAITEKARENFSRLDNAEQVELIGEDAAIALDRIDGPIDFLYLEAKDEENNSGYLEFLRQAYHKLPRGAWVIAHDTTAWDHQDDLRPYLAWVRDTRNFAESISFDVDQFGLELSVR
jgi:predicted O-methyltransferase YrrM